MPSQGDRGSQKDVTKSAGESSSRKGIQDFATRQYRLPEQTSQQKGIDPSSPVDTPGESSLREVHEDIASSKRRKSERNIETKEGILEKNGVQPEKIKEAVALIEEWHKAAYEVKKIVINELISKGGENIADHIIKATTETDRLTSAKIQGFLKDYGVPDDNISQASESLKYAFELSAKRRRIEEDPKGKGKQPERSSQSQDSESEASSPQDTGSTADQAEASEAIHEKIQINHKFSHPEVSCTIRVAHEKQLQIRGEGSEPGIHFSHENGFEIYIPPEVLNLNRKQYYYCTQATERMNALVPNSLPKSTANSISNAIARLIDGTGSSKFVGDWTIKYITENDTDQSST